MFASLDLTDTTETARTIWGQVSVLVRLVFGCCCSVEGYHHAGAFLLTGGRPCFRHAPDGREPMPCAIPVPNVWGAAGAFAEGHVLGYQGGHRIGWEEGYAAGFHEGTDRTLAVLSTLNPPDSGAALLVIA